jgi:ubiquinone/menaquinone biosynthesis C-methylase UbiE
MDKNQTDTIEAYNNSATEFMEKIGSMKNYNNTYDYLIQKLNKNDDVLDLACGPAQISKYIKEKVNANIFGVDLSQEMLKIAQKNIPDGVFYKDSIITFNANKLYDVIVLGFGIPYLNNRQVKQCIKNSVNLLKENGYIYLSFMEGHRQGFEKTSFGENNQFYIYYYENRGIKKILNNSGIKIEKEFMLDYYEPDGKITKDIILIGNKKHV